MLLSFLIPKEEQFFDLLENAATNATKSTEIFKSLMHNWNVKSDLFEQIRQVEHEGDLLTHEIMDRLNRTFVTPIDREDIHDLASKIDDVCDIIQALSDRMQLYELAQTIPPTMLRMADLLVESTKLVEAAVKEFHNSRRTSRVNDHLIEIKRIENEADDLLKHALADLFKTNDPMNVIRWKEIYEAIEHAHDKCAEVANAIEGVLVKNA